MNEKSVFNTGINYDSYFKKNISQSGFNLRLTQLIKQMLKEMKDEVYSDTYECSDAVSSKDDLFNWALTKEKKPKGSDIIIVESGPMTGTWRVKSEVMETPADLIKISGNTTSPEGGTISAVYVKVGEKMYSPDENGVIDLTGEFKTEDGQTVIQVVNSIQNDVSNTITQVEEVQSTIQQLTGKTTSLETTVSENTENITRIDADLTEVHNKIDSVEETVEGFDERISESEAKSEQAIAKVTELEPSVLSNSEKINYLDEKLDEEELSQLNDAIEITPDD